MSDYPRDLLITEDVIREFEEKVGVRFINKTECSKALAEHDAKVKKELIDRLIDSVGHAGYCTAAGCPFYKKCGGCDECYISDRTEELIIAWLKKEQKE